MVCLYFVRPSGRQDDDRRCRGLRAVLAAAARRHAARRLPADHLALRTHPDRLDRLPLARHVELLLEPDHLLLDERHVPRRVPLRPARSLPVPLRPPSRLPPLRQAADRRATALRRPSAAVRLPPRRHRPAAVDDDGSRGRPATRDERWWVAADARRQHADDRRPGRPLRRRRRQFGTAVALRVRRVGICVDDDAVDDAAAAVHRWNGVDVDAVELVGTGRRGEEARPTAVSSVADEETEQLSAVSGGHVAGAADDETVEGRRRQICALMMRRLADRWTLDVDGCMTVFV